MCGQLPVSQGNGDESCSVRGASDIQYSLGVALHGSHRSTIPSALATGVQLRLRPAAIAVLSCPLYTACAVVPPVPPDFALPIRAIIAQSVCELRDAFVDIEKKPQFDRFQARHWLVTIAIVPRADTDIGLSGGLTRKHVNDSVRAVTWALGGPGVSVNDKGIRSTGVNFNFKSGPLMDDRELQCPPEYPSVHVLAQHLGVGQWLIRSAEALRISKALTIDKPVYNTQITIRFAANGTYTYSFPAGADVAAAGASYGLDEQLNISMAPIDPPKQLVVVSLPNGQTFSEEAPVSRIQVESAQDRLDLLGIETAIQNLRVQ